MLTPNIRSIDSDARKTQLVNNAMNLFIRVGIDKVSMQLLARSSGVSKGVLYRYFESKADLMAAILLGDERELGAELESTRLHGDAAQVLEKYFRFRLQSIEKYKLLYEIETSLEEQKCQLARYDEWKQIRQRHVDLISDCIVGRLSGRRQGEHSGYYYGYVWSLIHGMAYLNDSVFFHQLINDRRGFTQFINDLSQKMLEL